MENEIKQAVQEIFAEHMKNFGLNNEHSLNELIDKLQEYCKKMQEKLEIAKEEKQDSLTIKEIQENVDKLISAIDNVKNYNFPQLQDARDEVNEEDFETDEEYEEEVEFVLSQMRNNAIDEIESFLSF